jgi:serine/threonine protein kinase
VLADFPLETRDLAREAMALTPDAASWRRLDAAFQGALDLPPGERAAYLDRVCGADTDLRAEVEAMLAADVPQHALGIERLVHDGEALSLDPDPFIGLRLGPWQVIDLLGHGGMGTVYLAERADGQYEQRVALKLVRGAARHSPGSTRFKAETYILARLSHPNIARVIDAGHTPEGSAWLVMEYVDGSPVTTHCDAHRLTIEERLRLFRVVCDATQHAHQSLVVHRDLKPSNIFVSGAGEVKLLDFGIAKLLEPDHPLADQTTPELRALTPAYAAPEQIRGEPVTTAADVYVLGVVLYELLTGQRHAGHEAASGVAFELPDMPLAPSLAVSRRLATNNDDARAALSDVAAARRTSPARLVRRLAGDIDRVVLKALQPEPERRYGSAGQLADDLQRLLDGRPVVAQPATLAYRVRRFIGRHRVGVTMASVLCALAVSFAVVATLQARAVRVERDRARLEASRAERVSLLVTDLFKLAEPAVGRGETITARELLERGSHRITMELQGDPEMQSALYNALARVYGNLGLHDAAIAVLQRALALELVADGEGALARAETLHLLAERHAARNDYATASRQFREALALRRRLKAPGAEVAATLEGLGRTLNTTGKFTEARALLEDAVAIRRSLPGASASELMSGLHQLGLLVHFQGDAVRAERLFREAVAVGRRIPGPSPEKVTSLLRHAELVAVFDRAPAKAEPLLREALAMARTIYSRDHQEVATCLGELAHNLLRLGRPAEAEPVAREGAAMVRRLYGDRHHETLQASLDLARVLRAERKLNEAEQLLRAALPQSRSLLGEGNPTTIVTARGLATVLEEQSRFREALDVRRDELARTAKALGEHDVFVATGLAGLGQHGLVRNRFDLAETYFTQALDLRRRIHPPEHWRIDEARGQLGVARLRAGRLPEAEADLRAAHEGLRAHRGPTANESVMVRARLVELYERWNRPEQARQYRSDAR